MRKLEERKRLGLSTSSREDLDCDNNLSNSITSRDGFDGEIDVVGDSGDGGFGRHDDGSDQEDQEPDDDAYEADTEQASTHRSPFSIDSLLQAPKVPRGRRPNSKYPRVQASKSMNPLAFGMMPLFPPTQPVGFQVAPLPASPFNSSQKDFVQDSGPTITNDYENLRAEDYEMRREEVKVIETESLHQNSEEHQNQEAESRDPETEQSRDQPNAAS